MTAALEFAGLALIAVGLWMFAPWLSVTVAGVLLFLMAVLRSGTKGEQ